MNIHFELNCKLRIARRLGRAYVDSYPATRTYKHCV